MPRYWHDKFAVAKLETDEERRLNRAILADKKPYFMCYIYPTLMRDYKRFIKQVNRNSLREFGLTPDEMLGKPYSELTSRQKEFLSYYDLNMPVSLGNCVINRICKRFEETFDGYVKKNVKRSDNFDYRMLSSGAQYTPQQKSKIKSLYISYNAILRDYIKLSKNERTDTDVVNAYKANLREEFIRNCAFICPDEEALCDIMLDVCYTNSKSKKFAWDICGEQMIRNLLKNNGNIIRYPTQSPDGEIIFDDLYFEIAELFVEDSEGGECDDYPEEE